MVKNQALIAARRAEGGFSDFIADSLGVVLEAGVGVLHSSIEAEFGDGLSP